MNHVEANLSKQLVSDAFLYCQFRGQIDNWCLVRLFYK